MNVNIEFSKKLIKGRIAETVFEQMMREEGEYTVIPFGYEHTMPTLAQYRGLVQVQKVIDNISDAPDFALISKDKTKVYLVEVKYQKNLNLEEIKKVSKRLLERWEYPWLFVATSRGFFCGMCQNIIKDDKIYNLSENWANKENQRAYLGLLKEFER